MRSQVSLLVLIGGMVAGLWACGSDPVAQRSCEGDACWSCQDVAVEGGHHTVCTTPDFGHTAPSAYECGPKPKGSVSIRSLGSSAPAGPCPPSRGLTKDGPLLGEVGGTIGSTSDGTQDSSGATQDGTHDVPPTQIGSGATADGAGSLQYICTSTGDLITCDGTTHDGNTTQDGDTGGGGKVDGGSSDGYGGCTLTQGYWKTHASAWPVPSLGIGGVPYSEAQLLTILGTPPGGDASLILAHQLIAAMLNLASGSGSAPVASVIASAQAWMTANKDADGRLPYGVAATSAAGAQAVALASQLDAYNNGQSGVPHCK